VNVNQNDYESITYETERGRARITLNRPNKLNAINNRMEIELEDALWRADDDTSVHCVIVCGAGRAFSAGYDLKEYSDPVEEPGHRGHTSLEDYTAHLEKTQRYLRAFADIHKPVIGQVHGYCLAGGSGIALFCDMVIASDDAVIGFPAGRAGTLPNQMWLYNAGPQWTKRLLMTGDSITGADAAAIGLVLKSVPADLLAAEVDGLADRLALVDTDLLSACKRICNLGLELMGASTLQRMAAEMDARAHMSEATKTFDAAIDQHGLKGAFRERDGQFGDGIARVRGPEIRDEQGRLIPLASGN
jgi:enoyl-CoA hydratase